MFCAIALVATMCFSDFERFFNGIFIEVIENCINALAIEAAIDHLLLGPGVRDLLYTDSNLHERDVTGG